MVSVVTVAEQNYNH